MRARLVASARRGAAGIGGGVTLHVQRQMVAATEGAVALAALERLVAGVLAEVARQLVAASELPRTVGPRALVGLLACVVKKKQKYVLVF